MTTELQDDDVEMTDYIADPSGSSLSGPAEREPLPLTNESPALSLLAADAKAGEDWPDLYGPLIGSWAVESSFIAADGTTRQVDGEWHFERVLGGMGVQDVLFAVGSPREQYGTSLRVVDPRSGLWHVVWMQPRSGEFVALIGRAEGDRIVHQGHPLDDPKGPLHRWSFTDISETSFSWIGEASPDGGLSWSLEQTMLGTRREGDPR
jgi:hypothetical protein